MDETLNGKPTVRIGRYIPLFVIFTLLLMCLVPLVFVNWAHSSVGLETDSFDITLKHNQRSPASQSPLLINLINTGQADAFNRSCQGLSIPFGESRLYLMGCTTVITP
jgi:hypothetical protein